MNFKSRCGTAAGLGFLLIAMPLYFVCAAVLHQLGFGSPFSPIQRILSNPASAHIFNVISPIFFVAALVLAFVVNGAAISSIKMEQENGEFMPVIAVKRKIWNLTVMVASLALLGILATYAFLENFSHRGV